MTARASISLSVDASPEHAHDDARYEAVSTRDPRAEGQFYYAVSTTGVYCRPTCASRLALRENVSFHATPSDAEQAGFRPCKRCRPRELPQRERHAQVIDAARRALESADGAVSLRALAEGAGLSPFYLHRLFKKHLGVTPHAYAAAYRLRRVADELRDGASVTAAIHEAGYSSSSRFYEAGSRALGMPPSDVRRGGEGVAIRAAISECSLGQVLVAATECGVCAVMFGDDRYSLAAELRARFPRASIGPSDDVLDALAVRVVAMIDESKMPATLPLDLMGTTFQQRVWRELQAVPRGTTVTYSEIARRIGAPRAVRAVGTACGKNPVAVAVPCHRVLREDGSLGGYRWGLARKQHLLAKEAAK
jgi:AraC family transcriptional regulator of adaptative response/methylated-DNA-[protein]-cysteine methyltransferase